jgi:hypothetical protein
MSGRKQNLTELAALLDGEVKDHRQAEELFAEIKTDREFAEEFELQREVKLLLQQLPPFVAPDFAATRVMGEIAARRAMKRTLHRRTWTAALAGFTVCLVAMLSLGGFFVRQGGVTLADLPGHSLSVQPGVFSDVSYAPQDWPQQVNVPEGADPQLKRFLEFASEQHRRSVMARSTGAVTPDMPQAIQVLDEGGTK